MFSFETLGCFEDELVALDKVCVRSHGSVIVTIASIEMVGVTAMGGTIVAR